MEIKKVHVYLPMAIPASGKTVLFQGIEEYFNQHHNGQSKIFIVSSDQVSLELMIEYQQAHPNTSKEDAYTKTRKQYKSRYDNAIKNVCKAAQQCQEQYIVIIFDKNHPENALKGPLEIVAQFFPNFISIALIPKVGKPLGNNLFSLTYLVSCVQRAIKRVNHETLVGSKEKIASVVLFFFSFFNKVQVDNLPVKKIFYIPFTNENDEQDKQLREQLIDLLKELRKQKLPEDIQQNCPQELAKFIEICEKNDLGFPDKNFQKQILWESMIQAEK